MGILEKSKRQECIGEGGYGHVYKSVSFETGIVFAEKSVKAWKEAHYVQFMREVQALKDCANVAGVPRLLDYDEKRWTLAMEFMEGETLSVKSCNNEVMPIGFFVSLAEIVHEINKCGWVHGDLKPHNVMVSTDGKPIVIDLGLSFTREHAEKNEVRPLYGTPGYLPPELHAKVESDRTIPLDSRVDVYSFGALLHRTMVGHTVFSERGTHIGMCETVKHQREGNLYPSAKLPEWAKRIILGCMALCPSDRYQSMWAVAEELRSAAAEADRDMWSTDSYFPPKTA